jgi:UDP-N-acetylmuramate-alanine ligase
MLEINPQILVLTNVAEDHMDFFKDLDDIKKHFQEFVNKLPEGGKFFKNIDDQNSAKINFGGQTVTFGQKNSADYVFASPVIKKGEQIFATKKKSKNCRANLSQVYATLMLWQHQ